jgi:hypothetical protein
MIKQTFNIRVFNNATSEFDRMVTLGPRRYQCGFIRSRRTGCYNVVIVHAHVEVRVEPALFRSLAGKAAADIAGEWAFTADELVLMGFKGVAS